MLIDILIDSLLKRPSPHPHPAPLPYSIAFVLNQVSVSVWLFLEFVFCSAGRFVYSCTNMIPS